MNTMIFELQRNEIIYWNRGTYTTRSRRKNENEFISELFGCSVCVLMVHIISPYLFFTFFYHGKYELIASAIYSTGSVISLLDLIVNKSEIFMSVLSSNCNEIEIEERERESICVWTRERRGQFQKFTLIWNWTPNIRYYIVILGQY